MTPRFLASGATGLLLFGLMACGEPAQKQAKEEPRGAVPAAEQPAVAAVDTERLIAADAEPGSWMAHGRTYAEQRFSPLKEIDTGNVGELGLAWYYDLGTKRGVEATSIVVDGVMYTTSSWSIVVALDARTGKPLWTFDPKVEKREGSA